MTLWCAFGSASPQCCRADAAGGSTGELNRIHRAEVDAFTAARTLLQQNEPLQHASVLFARTVFRSCFLSTRLGDLRMGGWVAESAAATSADFPGLASVENARHAASRTSYLSFPIVMDAGRRLLELFRALMPPVVMISAISVFPSRLRNLSTSEAAAVPQELVELGDEFPYIENTWVPLGRQSGCKCGDQTLRQLTPAMVDVILGQHQLYSNYPSSVKALQRLSNHKPSIDWRDWKSCEPLPNGAWSIEFRDVSFRYPNSLRFAVRNISFRLNAGGFLGIIGYSGAGKSTLLLLLSRIYSPTSGAILINDRPIECFPVRALRRRIGNAWQEANSLRFMSDLSIEGNVAMGNLAEAGDWSVATALQAAEAWSFIEARGRGRKGNLNVQELSGGEVERLNLARCMMKTQERSGAFLFDECTSAMDSLTESKIMARINAHVRLCGNGGAGSSLAVRPPTATTATRVMVSHRLSSLRGADEILVLADGAIIERGTWVQLQSSDRNVHFHRLFNSQQLSERPSVDG